MYIWLMKINMTYMDPMGHGRSLSTYLIGLSETLCKCVVSLKDIYFLYIHRFARKAKVRQLIMNDMGHISISIQFHYFTLL